MEIDLETLSLSPLLVGLNVAELKELVGAATIATYEDDAVIVEEGTPGESMFIVHDGQVVIEKEATSHESVAITHLGSRGDFFGEMVFVDILPRSATVRANPRATLIEFSLEVLRGFFEKNRDAHLSIVLNMTRVLSKRLRASTEQIAELRQRLGETA